MSVANGVQLNFPGNDNLFEISKYRDKVKMPYIGHKKNEVGSCRENWITLVHKMISSKWIINWFVWTVIKLSVADGCVGIRCNEIGMIWAWSVN